MPAHRRHIRCSTIYGIVYIVHIGSTLSVPSSAPSGGSETGVDVFHDGIDLHGSGDPLLVIQLFRDCNQSVNAARKIRVNCSEAAHTLIDVLVATRRH